MSNPRCPVCGQVNLVGATVCAVCDSRLDAPPHGAADDGPTCFDGDEPRAGALPTDIPSPHFQGAGDVIGPTLEVYRKHFAAVGLLVLVATLPLAALQYAAYLLPFDNSAGTGGLDPTTGAAGLAALALGHWATWLYWVLSYVANSLLAGALVYAVIELQRTGSVRAAGCLRWGLGKLPKVLAVEILSAVVINGVALAVLLLGLMLMGPLGMLLMALLLLYPYIVASVTLSLVVPAAAADNRGVFESFRRSSELTLGHKGLIFLTYFLWWLLTLIVSLVITWSFSARADGFSPAALAVQTLVGQFLKSTTYVLTTYIFLGILKERRQRAGAGASARTAAAPAG